MNSLTLSICALSLSDYTVYTTWTKSKMMILSKFGQPSVLSLIRNTTGDKAKQRILRVADVPEDVSLLIGASTDTNEVWIIPIADIEGITNIRLGKRWEKYRVRVCLETPTSSVADDADLKSSAKEASEKVKESLT